MNQKRLIIASPIMTRSEDLLNGIAHMKVDFITLRKISIHYIEGLPEQQVLSVDTVYQSPSDAFS